MMKLYYGPGACSFVPHVGLEAIKAATGEDFESQSVKLHKGEQQTPDYLALNPLGLVPVLVVDQHRPGCCRPSRGSARRRCPPSPG